MPDMADPKRLAFYLVQTRAERHVEIVQHHLAEIVRIMALRHPHAGQRRRMRLRILALGFQSPDLHRRARCGAMALVPREHVFEALFLEHRNRLSKAKQKIDRRRVGKGAELVEGDDFLPVPIGPHRRARLRHRKRLFRHRVEAEARRQHQPLLRTGNGDIDAPGIVLIFHRAEAGNGIDHQQRRMLGAVHRLADFERRRDAAGRGLVMDDHHGLDLVLAIRRKFCFDRFHIGAAAPITWDKINVEFEFVGDAVPQHGELAGLGHQHLVAGFERIDDRGFPGAGPGRGKNDNRLGGAEHALHGRHHRKAELGEFGTPMIQRRHVHRPQHPVGDVGRSWNLKKMPSSVQGHVSSFPGDSCNRGRPDNTFWQACPPTRKDPWGYSPGLPLARDHSRLSHRNRLDGPGAAGVLERLFGMHQEGRKAPQQQ